MRKEIFMPSDECRMPYAVYTPDAMSDGLPLILYLHGAGERGTVIEHLDRHGLPKMLAAGWQIPAIVFCPQCPADAVWDNIVFETKALLDRVAEAYHADRSRISVTGGSMGGFGTWSMGQAFPNFFSALAPLAGGGLSWRCPNLKTTPVHAYHGGEDGTVPVIYSRLMVDATNKAGGCAELTVLEGYSHNDGINTAYETMGIAEWLISQKRTDFSPVPEFCSQYF